MRQSKCKGLEAALQLLSSRKTKKARDLECRESRKNWMREKVWGRARRALHATQRTRN